MNLHIGILYAGLIAMSFVVIKLIEICILLEKKIDDTNRRIK